MNLYDRYSEAPAAGRSATATYDIVNTPAVYPDDGLGEEENRARKLWKNPKVIGAVIAVAVVGVIVVLGTTLSGGGSGDNSKQTGADALSGDVANNFDAVWRCRTSVSESWDSASCGATNDQASCEGQGLREVSCCLAESGAGECQPADSYGRCDAKRAPNTCETGNAWFCQKPGAAEAVPVFAKSYCSLPLTCDETTGRVERRRRCCSASSPVCVEETADQCGVVTEPDFCDPSTPQPTEDSSSSSLNVTAEGRTGNVTADSTLEADSTTSTAPTVTPVPSTTVPSTSLPTLSPSTSISTPGPAPSTQAPPPPPPPASKEPSFGEGMTVINNCGGGTTVYYGSLGGAGNDIAAVPSQCADGRYCPARVLIPSGSRAFWIANTGFPGDNQAARTLAEVNIDGANLYWYDISRVKGFNVGAKIEHRKAGGAPSGSHTATCTHVNCDDAYYMCDTAGANVYNPDYQAPVAGSSLTITFCPSGPDSFPLQMVRAYPGLKRAQPPNAGPYMCDCDASAWIPFAKQIPAVGTRIMPASGQCGPL